jgi:hypothetical protein
VGGHIIVGRHRSGLGRRKNVRERRKKRGRGNRRDMRNSSGRRRLERGTEYKRETGLEGEGRGRGEGIEWRYRNGRGGGEGKEELPPIPLADPNDM